MKPALAKALATVKDLSPEIGAYGGTALMIGGGIWLAINAYKYLPEIVDDYNEGMAEIESYIIDEDYTEKDKKKDISELRMNTAKRLVKALGLPSLTMAAGATGNIAGFKAEKKKYVAAMVFAEATAATLDKVVNRVEEKWGEDGRRYVLNGEEPVEIEDQETGEKKKVYKGSETDLAWPISPYCMTIDRGHLYEHSGGNATLLLSALHEYEDLVNVQINAGTPVYYYDILRYIFGEEVISVLEDHNLIHDDIRQLGWYLKDPKNRDNMEAGRIFNLRADTWLGKVGDDDPYDNDKVWVRINPNIPGMIDLVHSKRKIRTGGKYISQI